MSRRKTVAAWVILFALALTLLVIEYATNVTDAKAAVVSSNMSGICPAWSKQPGDHITYASGHRFMEAWRAKHPHVVYAGWSNEVVPTSAKARYSITYIDAQNKTHYIWWDTVNLCPVTP